VSGANRSETDTKIRRKWRYSLHAMRSAPQRVPAPINCTSPSTKLIAFGVAPLGHRSLSGRTTPFASG